MSWQCWAGGCEPEGWWSDGCDGGRCEARPCVTVMAADVPRRDGAATALRRLEAWPRRSDRYGSHPHGTVPAVFDRVDGQAVAGRWHGHGGGGVGLRTWRSRRSPRRAVRRLATHGGVWRRPLLTLLLAPSPATHLLSITAPSTSCGGGGPIYCGSAGSAPQSPRYHGGEDNVDCAVRAGAPGVFAPRRRSRSREAKCQCV